MQNKMGSLMKKNKGFTLIELMVVVVIVAILATIAVPSYQHFILNSHARAAQAKLLEIAQNMEKYKSRNFSYRGYTPTSETSGSPTQYNITIVGTTSLDADKKEVVGDLATEGSGWVMKAVPTNPKNYTYLINSNGVRCRNKLASNVTYMSCGGETNGSENW